MESRRYPKEGGTMKNVLGHSITITLFGESHGEAIGCVIDGMPSGLEISLPYIEAQLSLRKAKDALSTSRKEADQIEILSGVKEGFSEGTPIALLIRNQNVHKKDYEDLEGIARPGHADYTAQIRYDGYQDASGGGHFSGRLTAPLVAAGAVFRYALEKKGIYIGSHISNLHGINDMAFDAETLDAQLHQLNTKEFPVLDDFVAEAMKREILQAKENQDSVGGILETLVTHMPVGIGEPMFSSVESRLSEALFSIPAVKGVSFGSGFGFAEMLGSEANDACHIDNDVVYTKTNHNGGINGGITNGMPIVFQTVIKPTPSISQPQETIDFLKKENTTITITGRHDPAIIHRARVVVDCLTAFILADMLNEAYGRNWLRD